MKTTVVTFIIALIESAILILIDWALLRFWGEVEIDALAFMVACSALFLVCKNDLKDTKGD